MVKIVIFILSLLLSFPSLAQQDPTQPLNWSTPKAKTSKKVKKPSLPRLPNLQSVICDSYAQCTHAVINNTMVQKGQMINGYRVADIQDNQVSLIRNGRTQTIQLFPKIQN